jgi:hypothetical protein
VINRSRAFYDGMKANNFFITGEDNYIYAAMLALSDINVSEGVTCIKQLLDRLKGSFWDKSSVQALSCVLVLGGVDCTQQTAERVLTLRESFKANKVKLDKIYTLPSLGVISLLSAESDIIIRDIQNAQQTLKSSKALGIFADSQQILLYAAAIVADEYSQSDIMKATMSTSVTNIIIAQQIAIMMAIIASTTAAAAASSG